MYAHIDNNTKNNAIHDYTRTDDKYNEADSAALIEGLRKFQSVNQFKRTQGRPLSCTQTACTRYKSDRPGTCLCQPAPKHCPVLRYIQGEPLV